MKFSLLSLALAATATFTSAAPLERRRFGQEQEIQFGAKIAAVSDGCESNGDATLGFGGQEISTLLGGADPCDKLQLADDLVARAKEICPANVVDELILVAMELVKGEKNFNPFAGNKDSICLDPALPATPELQGILQLVDPRLDPPNNEDTELAALAAQYNQVVESVLAQAKAAGTGPGNNGKSLAQLTADNGFDQIIGFDGVAADIQIINDATTTTEDLAATTTEEATTTTEDVAIVTVDANVGNKQCVFDQLEFIDRGKEQRFGVRGQQVALNPVIVIERICNGFGRQRDFECEDICNQLKEVVSSTGLKGSSNGSSDVNLLKGLANEFNQALAGGADNVVVGADVTTTVDIVIAAPEETGVAVVAGAGSLGICDPEQAKLVVGLGVDAGGERAQEVRFVPGGFEVDPIFGGQASALNGGIIAKFICDRLASDCRADAAVVDACRAAQLNVDGQRGGKNLDDAALALLGKVADDFNQAIGIGTNFQADVIGGGVIVGGAAGMHDPPAVADLANPNEDLQEIITLLKQAIDILTA